MLQGYKEQQEGGSHCLLWLFLIPLDLSFYALSGYKLPAGDHMHFGSLQVIMATNRIESLDPALIRPGRIDRKIEFPLPDTKTKRRIFGIHTGRMTLGEDVNLEEFVLSKVWTRYCWKHTRDAVSNWPAATHV